jgi:hypothetical protein
MNDVWMPHPYLSSLGSDRPMQQDTPLDGGDRSGLLWGRHGSRLFGWFHGYSAIRAMRVVRAREAIRRDVYLTDEKLDLTVEAILRVLRG